MTRTLLDVTDLVEFLQRQESVSGVQRVIAETAPLLLPRIDGAVVVLDRPRGVFVELTPDETDVIVVRGSRSQRTARTWPRGARCLARARPPCPWGSIPAHPRLPRRGLDQRRPHARRARRACGRRPVRLPALRPDARAPDRAHGCRQPALRPLPHARHADGPRVPAISASSRRTTRATARARLDRRRRAVSRACPAAGPPRQFDTSAPGRARMPCSSARSSRARTTSSRCGPGAR